MLQYCAAAEVLFVIEHELTLQVTFGILWKGCGNVIEPIADMLLPSIGVLAILLNVLVPDCILISIRSKTTSIFALKS